MPKVITPKVFLIGETVMVGKKNIDQDGAAGLYGFLEHLGVPEWRTNASSDSEMLCEVAGKSCYLSFSADLNKNLTKVGTRTNARYLQEGIIGTKHGSVLEHASVTFALVDVSRVLTHELVRHRAGCAFSQVSGRYVRTDELRYFLPKVIKDNPDAVRMFGNAFKKMEEWAEDLSLLFSINEMKDFSLKKTLTSAFRRLIGNGQANHIIFTANHRALRHIIEMRTSRAAEEEIRHVFAEIFRLVSTRYPAFYADARIETFEGIPEVIFLAGKI